MFSVVPRLGHIHHGFSKLFFLSVNWNYASASQN